jgi:signal transduction histidine kinase
MRPRRGALGLRGRIVGAVLVTTVATLAIAALTLLGPLEQSLRHAALKTLQHDLGGGATAPFRKLDVHLLDKQVTRDTYSQTGQVEAATLAQAEQTLGTRIGATVTLLGYFDASGHGLPVLPGEQLLDVNALGDAQKAFLTGHTVPSFGSDDGRQYARMAIPITSGAQRYVLVARKPIDEIPGAVRAVRTAFIYAALAGLALTLVLAIPLAATLVRRLRRLRQAALGLAQGEPVELPVDRARDEVGDLGRAFSIMQLRLQQQEEARRAFVATASHELRTPLTSLEGMLELLDEDLHDASPDLQDARSLLERARAQSHRLARLAADLLDLSRIDAQVTLRSEPVELGELSRAVVAEFELGSAEQGVTPILDDASGPVWATGDPGSVARILRILLENAMRVSPRGAEIRIELRNGGAAVLSVCDQGPGVPLQERELIFERFQRGRDTRGQAGFGLGLAIGRELAERMGGELVLEEQASSGAKFTLRLPAARATEAEPLMIS